MPTLSDHTSHLHADMQACRHDIHRHPELAFEENRTAGIVAELLESWGIEMHRGIGKTGVVGVLKKGDADRSIGLRADMDALMIHESNDFEHRSLHEAAQAREEALQARLADMEEQQRDLTFHFEAQLKIAQVLAVQVSPWTYLSFCLYRADFCCPPFHAGHDGA